MFCLLGCFLVIAACSWQVLVGAKWGLLDCRLAANGDPFIRAFLFGNRGPFPIRIHESLIFAVYLCDLFSCRFWFEPI